jgi:hypothetical protein
VADPTIERGRGAIESILSRAKKREELDGYIGNPNGSGGHTVAVPHHPGYSYIRGNTGIEGWIAEAVNIGALPDPAVQVEIAKKNGRLIVRAPDGASAATVLGVNAPAAGSPPGVQSVNTGTAQVVKSQLVEGGRLTTIGADKAYLTGLKARITPYIHSGGAWDGLTLVTLTPTATSGMHSYVLVGINTKTNAITQALTANMSLAMPLLQNDLFKVMRLYPDVDWRGAVDLANGATSIDEGKLIDVRSFGTWRPKCNFTATAAPGVGDDVDDGYAVGSMWIDVTGDVVYVCVDATAGAAVWNTVGGAFSGDAFDVPYTPTTGGDWSSAPSDVGEALDTLAADVAGLSVGGGAPAAAKYMTYGYDGTLSTEKAIPAWEFHPDIEPASPNAADDEFAGSSLGGSWSWVNQGSASAAVAKSRLLLSVPSTSTGNIRGIFRTYPGQSTWEAQITGWSSAPVWSGANNYSFAISRRDSSTGRIENYAISWAAGSTTALLVLCDRWTNATTFSATVATAQLCRSTFGTFYLRVEDNGTNLIFSWSLDGINYTQLTSFARAAFLANADQIGFTIFTQQSSGTIYLQSDWMRRTA